MAPPAWHHRGMNKLLLACLATLPILAQAQESALRQCRAIADAQARLACYDGIPLAAASAPPSPQPKPAAASATSAPLAGAVPVAVPAAPPAAPPAAAPLAAQFGLPSPAEAILAVETRFEGLFEGWRPGERIRLANGQVWQVVDGSSGVYDLKNPKVTIRRGALGRYFLDIEGAAKTPTVRRVE